MLKVLFHFRKAVKIPFSHLILCVKRPVQIPLEIITWSWSLLEVVTGWTWKQATSRLCLSLFHAPNTLNIHAHDPFQRTLITGFFCCLCIESYIQYQSTWAYVLILYHVFEETKQKKIYIVQKAITYTTGYLTALIQFTPLLPPLQPRTHTQKQQFPLLFLRC